MYTFYQGMTAENGIPPFDLMAAREAHPNNKAQARAPCLFRWQSWADSMILSVRCVKPLAKFISSSRVRYRSVARRPPWDHSYM
jgi:hypothetical protein